MHGNAEGQSMQMVEDHQADHGLPWAKGPSMTFCLETITVTSLMSSKAFQVARNLPGACITCSEKAGLWRSALSLLMAAEDSVSQGFDLGVLW